MKSFKTLLLMGSFVLGTSIVPQAKADEWNHKTFLTFSGPVELPGVVLPAGTYVFKLLDSESNRDIVQVFSKNEDKVFATILAVPDYRLEPTGKTVITFEERPVGKPEAIKAWFYPGSTHGEEFVYPALRGAELAKANGQHVPVMPAEMGASVTKPAQSAEVQQMRKAPISAVQPSGKEVQLAEVHPPQQQVQATPQAASAAAAPKLLPKTASPLPLIGLSGIMSLAAALAIRFFSTRAA